MVSVGVVIGYLVKNLADVRLYSVALRSRVDYISDGYFEHVSNDKRKFAYALASERNFRDLSERYVVNKTFEVLDGVFVFKNMIDELAYFFVLYLGERFVIVKIGKTEVQHIIVERSRPRRIFGTVVYRIAEDFVGNRKNYIRRACVVA